MLNEVSEEMGVGRLLNEASEEVWIGCCIGDVIWIVTSYGDKNPQCNLIGFLLGNHN